MNNLLIAFLWSRKKVLPLILVLNMGNCWAAPEDNSELPFIMDVPVVLSASRLRQTQADAPNAVTIIDRDMIKASGFRTIADLFSLVPGMYVDYQSGYEPIVGYRGATDAFSRRMQVLIDGSSVYLPPYNIVDWGDLPLHIEDIERIEVVRGPAATSYGSNSILGVINIITRDASALNNARLSITRGNAGNADISDIAAHFGKSGEHLDYRFTLGMRSDNGLNFPANYTRVFDGYNDSSSAHLFSLRSNYHPNSTDSIDFQLGYSNGVRATGNPQNTLFTPRNVETTYGNQQITWLHALDHRDEVRMHYYHISRELTDERYSLPVSGVSYWLADHINAQRHEVELQHTVHTSQDNRIVWGAAMRYDTADAPVLLQSRQSSHQYRLFAHDEWRILQPLLLNAGAMAENDGMGHKKISPRAALNYHLTPEHTFRTGIAVAYRNPAFGEESSNWRYVTGPELHQYWLSSGGVRPERALSREIGYIGKFDDGLSIDARVYNDQVSDIIWVDAILVSAPGLTSQVNPTWDFRNEFTAHYTGLEATAKYKWEKNSLTLNYARQSVSAVLQGTPRTASFISMFQGFAQDFSKTVPRNSGSLLYARQMDGSWSLGLGYYQQSTVKVLDGVEAQPMKRRMDMRIAKQFGTPGNNITGVQEIILVIQNVFQNENIGYSGYSFDRRAYFVAAANF